MTFAVPLFLIGALAAAIPVVLHMVNRQKAQELPFSTLRFLRISVQKTRRRKRVHDVLLMLVRAAVLLLIAVGLARPALTNLSSLWGGADTAVVIILDNSASMGTVDRGEVRWRTALRAAEQILDQLREGDQVALLPTCGPTSAHQGKLDRTHEKVRQMLLEWINAPSKTGGVTYERADLAAKLQRARAMLAKAEATTKQIYVLSDMQRLSWEGSGDSGRFGPAGTAELDGRLAAAGTAAKPAPEELVPVILVDCHRAPKPNVALSSVSLATAVPVAGVPIGVTAELFNTSPDAQGRHLDLYLDGAKEESSPVLSVPPGGKLTHEFTFTPTRGGLHRGEVRLAGDDGSSLDDRRFFTVEVDQGIPVAVVKPRPHEIPYLDDAFYVERALAPGKSGAWAIRTTTLTAGDLSSEPLSDYKVVFCVNLPAPEGDTAGRLAAYLAGGGNLVWICGENVDPAAYNQMDRQTGGKLLSAPLLDVRTASRGLSRFSRSENGTVPLGDADRDSWQIGFLDRTHPALSPLTEPAALYRSVLVYKHVGIDDALPSVGDANSLPNGRADLRVLARLDDGQPLLVQRKVDRGQVLLLGTSAHVDWSNLPLRPIFLPLLVRLTYELAGAEQARHTLLAGSPLVLPLEGAARPAGVEILPPGGEVIRRKTEDAQGRAVSTFRYDDTHQIGIYELRLLPSGGGGQIGYAVNVDPDEADPAKIEREEIQKLLGPTPLVLAEDPDDLTGTFTQLREGTSLGGLLLTGVLIALVFESLLANRLSPKHQQTTAEQPPPGMRRLAKKGRGAA